MLSPAVSEGGSDGPSRTTRTASVEAADAPKPDGPVRRSMRAAAAAARDPPAAKATPVQQDPQTREVTPVAAAAGGAAGGGGAGPAGVPAPRQAPLNMSNVGRRDREAARALLGFTQMAAGVSAARSKLTAGHLLTMITTYMQLCSFGACSCILCCLERLAKAHCVQARRSWF